MKDAAIILGDSLLRTPYGKTAHGLLRQSERFSIVGVVEHEKGSGDAGDLIGVSPIGIPISPTVEGAIAAAPVNPTWAIVGIATPGGIMTPGVRSLVLSAAKNGLSIVNGLHEFVADIREVANLAKEKGAQIIDLRRPKRPSEMSPWTGQICALPTVRIAVLGTDCIVGKRTTAGIIVQAVRSRGISSEMIFTGQTGWLQGADFGFFLDATINDFVAGEMEAALIACAKHKAPAVMIIEGQSSMQNPSTPCGAEIILSGAVHGVVIQHAPGRRAFCGYDTLPMRPSLETEIGILQAYRKPLLGICLNFADAADISAVQYVDALKARYQVPVLDPMKDIVDPIIDSIVSLVREISARNLDLPKDTPPRAHEPSG
jgi:uncharacterized NAD-dependent epimerase/dehydratase family protein